MRKPPFSCLALTSIIQRAPQILLPVEGQKWVYTISSTRSWHVAFVVNKRQQRKNQSTVCLDCSNVIEPGQLEQQRCSVLKPVGFRK